MKIRRTNRGEILRLLATEKANTRVELAKASKLTKMSVSNIIDEFLSNDIVVEGEMIEQKVRGKNPVFLSISPKAPKIIGVLIAREYCSAILCDMNLKIIIEKTVTLSKSTNVDKWLQVIYSLIDDLLEQEKNICGIGVASIGPLDVKKGLILSPPRFYGISKIVITNVLESRYKLPVYLDHQYNSAAKAEKLFGIAEQYSSFMFVGVTDGIGAGIYQRNHLLQSNGLGSELGHMSIDYNGAKCDCSIPGCIENYASTAAIVKEVAKKTGRQISFEECCRESASSGAIDVIISSAIDKLTLCLTGVVNLLNPELIILGHDGVQIPGRYLSEMEEYINLHKLSGDYNHISVKKSGFGERAQLLGSACNVIDAIFKGNITI